MHYKATDFNCRPNSLKKIKAGEYTIIGNSGTKYTIKKIDELYNRNSPKRNKKLIWNIEGVAWRRTLEQCLIKLKTLEHLKRPAIEPKPQPKTTYTDGTNAEIVRLRAENKKLEEAFDKLSDMNGEKIDRLSQFKDSIAQLFCLFGDEVDSDYLIKVVGATIKRAHDQLDDLAKARDTISGRMAQINRLETACRNHKLEVAQLEKQLGIYEWARAMMEVVR